MARRASPVKYAVGVFSVNISFASCHEIIARNANIHVMRRRARRASPLLSLAEARLNTRKQVKDLRLRVRAFGAIVGARHASPVVCAAHIL